jgi:hypothetical protein
MQNFDLPYFANTVKGFWRKWHISLTGWFTEYVYISMGGNRIQTSRWIINILMVFLLSGLWHGATLSFLLWGLIHGVLYLAEHYFGIKKPNWIYHIIVFVMITFAWVFFRIDNPVTAGNIIAKIGTDFFSPIYWGTSAFSTAVSLILLLLLIIREYLMHKKIEIRAQLLENVILLIMIALFGVSNDKFVYFQF